MASLRVKSSRHGTSAFIAAEGDLTPGTASALTDAAIAELTHDVTALVLDLRGVRPEPVAAAQSLVAITARCKQDGVSVQLCAGDAVRDALEVGKTLALFSAIDDAVDAAGSLEAVLGESVDAAGAVARDGEVTWITTDEPDTVAGHGPGSHGRPDAVGEERAAGC